MKKLEINFLKASNAIIAGLLALLGCSCDEITKAEYGTPSAKFIVNGKVQSSQTNEAIKNIRVVMNNDTAFTNADGTYEVIDNSSFPENQTFTITFEDIDSVENGKFNDLDTIVEFKDPKFTGGDGHWYKGETSKEFNVNLEPGK